MGDLCSPIPKVIRRFHSGCPRIVNVVVTLDCCKGGFPRGEIIDEFATKNISYSDWLKMFGEFFRHTKK